MVCTLNIDASLLIGMWGYKYVVYSPKMVSGDDCFEYLHSFDGRHLKNPNRCLKVNRSDLDSKFLHTLLIFNMYVFFVFCRK